MHPSLTWTLPERVPSKVGNRDSRCMFGINCAMAVATIHNDAIATTSMLLDRAWDADEGV